MNFFNRALKNVTRKMSKSVLLAVTFFLIGNLVIIGLGINNAAENAKILTRQKMRAVVSLELDYTTYYNDADKITDDDEREAFYKNSPRLTLDKVEKLKADSRVKAVNFISTQQMYAKDFESVPLNNDFDKNYNQQENTGNHRNLQRCGIKLYQKKSACQKRDRPIRQTGGYKSYSHRYEGA